VELTWSQQRVVDQDSPRLRVTGEAGSGKTTALVRRWLRLAGTEGPARVLVICGSRPSADRFRDAVMAEWQAGVDVLPVTTWHGAAFDILRRQGDERQLVTGAEHWAAVQRILAGDGTDLWPTCAPLVSRAAFVDEVAGATLAVEGSGLSDERIMARAEASGVGERWGELLGFLGRSTAPLAARGRVDASGLIAAAAESLSDPAVAAGQRSRWSDVLVDDAQATTPVMATLIERLDPARLVVAGDVAIAVGWARGESPAWFETATDWQDQIDVGVSRRMPPPPELVRCHHPAVEPDAVAGELLRASRAGVSWSAMAVLVRRDRDRARALGRGLARHRIPVHVVPGSAAEEPAVRAVVDLLAWAAGDEQAQYRLLASPLTGLDPAETRKLVQGSSAGGPPLADHPRLAALFALRAELAPKVALGDPVELVWEVWRALQPELVPDPDAGPPDPASWRALDAVVAFVAGLSQRAGRDPAWRLSDELTLLDGADLDPDPWHSAAIEDRDAVTVTTVAQATGREWHTVVVAGCLEGELPRISGFVHYFDRAVLDPAHTGSHPLPTAAARRLASLDEERRLFHLARSRATGLLVGTAAPQVGQLISRWVRQWPERSPVLPVPAAAPPGGDAAVAALPTPGLVPVHPDRRLTLSASQLTTYADCPLRYAFQYALAVKTDAGVWAGMGSWVHDALADFADPEGPDDRSWERLRAVAERHWSDTIALYQPQREEIRRDVFTMLERWWIAEWSASQAPEVLAVERPFSISVGEHQVIGRIDRIDRVPGGIAVIDYKTGRTVSKESEMATDLQLATYHLAAVRDAGLAAFGPPVSLRLLYLRDMAVREQPVTDDHEAATEACILDMATHVLAEEFAPNVDADCDHCDFHRLCPLQPEGREVGAI
jgi:superfamily I DNA/RNA helicase/RecB family exonuclease